MNRILPPLLFSLSMLVLAENGPGQTLTTTWTGATSSDWQTAGNWTPAAPDFNTTISARINVSNGANNALSYTAAEGTTTLAAGGYRGLVIGSGVSGAMIITGGAFSSSAAATGDVLGNGAGSTGSLTVSGGSFTSSSSGLTMALSGSSTGIFTVAGGTSSVTTLIVSGNSAGTGIVNLNGGRLNATTISQNGGSSTLNFNGGTLAARASTTTFLSGLTRANVRDGGAVIDSNGFNVTVAQALVHSDIGGDNARDGGLTKNGAGTLTLTGINTYTGNTVVQAGSLTLADNAQLTFFYVDGTFNALSGAGTLTLDGDFLFDLTGAAAGTYSLIEAGLLANTSFGSTFSVANAGWTESSGIWTSADGLSSFSELSGQLTVIPEPSVAALVFSSLLVPVFLRRRAR